MSTVTIYNYDNGQLTLERLRGRQVILRVIESSGLLLPVCRCSCAHLSVMMSLYDRTHQHAARIDWPDTQKIIRYCLEDSDNKKDYKPSCMMHYKFQIAPSSDMESIGLNFNVFYTLWKKGTSDEGQLYWTEIQTEPQDFNFALSAEEFFKMICYVSILDGDTATAMWNAAINANFIMESDYDFGDMDVEVLEAIYDDFDFGRNED